MAQYTKSEFYCIRCNEKYLGGSGSKYCLDCKYWITKERRRLKQNEKRLAARLNK